MELLKQHIEKHIDAHKDMAFDNGWFFREPSKKELDDLSARVEAVIAESVYELTIKK